MRNEYDMLILIIVPALSKYSAINHKIHLFPKNTAISYVVSWASYENSNYRYPATAKKTLGANE